VVTLSRWESPQTVHDWQPIGNQMSNDRSWKTIPGKKGVQVRDHPTRKHGRKQQDRCFCIRHTVDGKRIVEVLGWATDGWTMEMAEDQVREFRRNAKTGEGPRTYAEKLALRKAKEEEAERQAELARRVAEMEQAKDVTFSELSSYYRIWADGHRTSADDVARNLTLHILPLIGHMKASEINSATINEVKAALLKKKPASGRNKTLSPQTVMHCLKTIRETYNFARETPHPKFPETMLFVGPNPAVMRRKGRGVRTPQVDNRRLRILSEAECTSILGYKAKTARDTENIRAMVLLSLDTGIRAGELVRLRWEDVNTDTGALNIVLGSDRGTTKSGLGRIVHAGQLYPEALLMLKKRQRTSPLVFPGKDGAVRDGSAISRAMVRISRKLGLNDGVTDDRNRVVWHTLRHTYATRMLEAGVDIYILKELMGHHSVTVTERYLHLCDRSKRAHALAAAATGRAHLSPPGLSRADTAQTLPEDSRPPLQ